jgi:hypothetical protein
MRIATHPGECFREEFIIPLRLSASVSVGVAVWNHLQSLSE